MTTKRAKQKLDRVNTELKAGDTVMVISGGNKKKRPIKGQVGKIKAIVGDRNDRVVIEGLNVHVKHKRAAGPNGESGRISVEKPIHISNVMYYVESLSRPVRLKRSRGSDGKSVRGYTDPVTKAFVAIGA